MRSEPQTGLLGLGAHFRRMPSATTGTSKSEVVLGRGFKICCTGGKFFPESATTILPFFSFLALFGGLGKVKKALSTRVLRVEMQI